MKNGSSSKDFSLTKEEIADFTLEVAEEKALYLRYLIRREHQDFKVIKYQYLLENLKKRILSLQKSMPSPGTGSSGKNN